MYLIANKSNLARHLNKCQQAFPEEFKFFPKTWVLPTEMHELRAHYESSRGKMMMICKPSQACQGKGIFITKNIKKIPTDKTAVVQKYLKSPCLLDELKFDLRIYVLVTSSDPLKIYLFKEGLARFATVKYKANNTGPI